MTAWKWCARALAVAVVASLVGGLTGCESTKGGGSRGSDGHVGHNH